MQNGRPHIFISGSSSVRLAKSMAEAVDAEFLAVEKKVHNNGGMELKFPSNMRKFDITVVGSSAGDPQGDFAESLSLVANARAAKPNSVIFVQPNPFNERADRKYGNRGAPMFSLLGRALAPYCDEVVLADPHNRDAAAGVYGDSVTMVNMAYPFAIQLRHMIDRGFFGVEDLVPVHADLGGPKRITPDFRNCCSEVIKWDYSTHDDDWAHVLNIRNASDLHKSSRGATGLDDIEGKVGVIFEDIGDTMGTLCSTAKDLKEAGAKAVIGCISKLLVSPKREDGEPILASIERINESDIDLLLATNLIDYRRESPPRSKAIRESSVIHTIDVARYMAAYVTALREEPTSQKHRDQNSPSALNRGDHPDMLFDEQTLVEPVELKEGCPLLQS